MISRITIAILLILTTTAYAAPVQDTGQTKCYDNDVEIICPSSDGSYNFYGQDANYSF